MATRSRFQTMPTGGHGNDVGPAAVTGTAAGNVRRFTPIKPTRDLQTVLAPLDDDQYGSQFGPRYVGTLKLPMSSEGHILSAPGLLTVAEKLLNTEYSPPFLKGLLIRRELPLSASSGVFI